MRLEDIRDVAKYPTVQRKEPPRTKTDVSQMLLLPRLRNLGLQQPPNFYEIGVFTEECLKLQKYNPYVEMISATAPHLSL